MGFFACAKEPHSTKISHSFLSDSFFIVASVNISRHILLCDIGSHLLTVREALIMNTHCSARFCKYQSFGVSIHRSFFNSLKIFFRDGGCFIHGSTEKHNQCACHGQ